MPTVLPNPAWPVLDVQVDCTTGPPNTPSARLSLQRQGMGISQVATQRGRQYEQGHCEAGTANVVVNDPKELLNPINIGSPFNTGAQKILPYRSMWIPVMWPVAPGSGNIINTGVNSAYDPSFEASTGSNPALWAPAGGTTTCVVSTAQHFDGAKSMLVTQSAAGVGFGAVNSFRTVPGLTYTMSAYVYPTGGCSVTMQVLDAAGVVHASNTATTQNVWTRLTLTWTTVDTLESVTVYGTVTGTPTWYLDATQLEFGASASAFTTSGPTGYQIYSGYVERWPETWDFQGFRGKHPLSCVDALSVLSRAAIAQSYLTTIKSDSPQLYLPLSDAAPPGRFTIGGNGFLSTPSPSTNGQFSWGGDQFLDGTSALVVSQNNALNPPANGGPNQDTEWNITQGTFSLNTSAGTFETWFKFTSGNTTPFQVAVVTDGKTVFPDQQYINLASTFNGQMRVQIQDSVSGLGFFTDNLPGAYAGFNDGQWHYLAVTLFAANAFAVTCDGSEVVYGMPNPHLAPVWGVNNIHFDANTGLGDPASQMSVCNWAYYPLDIGSISRNNHYNRGVGYINELSGARVTRLLTKYWNGAKTVAGGFIQLAPDFSYNGRTVLDALTEIADTEGGLVYAARDGTVVFEDRTTRYTSQASVATFGDGPGELPYENIEFDFDPTYVYSQANLSRPGNSNFAPVVNSASQTTYGQRILSQQLQVNNDFDLTQATLFYLQRYGNPKPRLRKVTLNPAGNNGMWPTVLSLEISQRVTVRRRVNGVVMSADYYIEQINHNIDIENCTWTVDLQLSPVFVPQAWVLGDAVYGVLGTTTVPVY